MSITYETPRKFGSREHESYQEGRILDCNETGPIDLISPAHEFKLVDTTQGFDQQLAKCVKETLKFSNALLNSRSNGTIHFGIADEIEENANQFGKRPGEIVGVKIEYSQRHKFISGVSEAIKKGYGKIVGPEECIRPPLFILVRPRDDTASQANRYVIEVDIEPKSAHCKDTYFKVTLPGQKQAKILIRDGANSKEVHKNDSYNFFHRILPNTIKAREEAEQKENQTKTPEELTKKLDRQICLKGTLSDTYVTRILLISETDLKIFENDDFSFLKREPFDQVIVVDGNRLCEIGVEAENLSKTYVISRTKIWCVVSSESTDTMALVIDEFTKYFSPNQIFFYCHKNECLESFKNHLLAKYYSRKIFLGRSTIIDWSCIYQAVKQGTLGYSHDKLHVPGPNGTVNEYVKNEYDTDDIKVLDVKKCDQLFNLTPQEFRKVSHEEEERFYRGAPVCWQNLWFTQEHESHVINRDSFREIDEKIDEALRLDGRIHRVSTVTLFHQKGTGASTVLKQIMWKYSKKTPYQCRCCIVKQITENTPNDIMAFHTQEENALPVLVLIDDHDEKSVQSLIDQIQAKVKNVLNCEKPTVVLLCGQRCCSPNHSSNMHEQPSVYIKNGLSRQEYQRFERKFFHLKERFALNSEDFKVYADKSILMFKILLNPDKQATEKYVKQVIQQVFKDCRDKRYELIKYLTLLLVSFCKNLRIKSKWVQEILDSSGQVFKFTGEHHRPSMQLTEKHPIISKCIIGYVEKDSIMHDILKGPDILPLIETIFESPANNQGEGIMQTGILEEFNQWRFTLGAVPDTDIIAEETITARQRAQ